MADRFHVNCELAPGLVVLTGPEAHHMAVVCRVRPNAPILLFNGDGRQYPARVIEVTRRDVTVEIHSVESPVRELPRPVHIAACLPKGDRAQFLVEKLTELGVSTLHLLLTRRAVVHPRESKVDRLERYVIEASKQCGRNVLMRIEPPCEWESFVSAPGLPGMRLVAHPGQGLSSGSLHGPGTEVVAAVGPEGGFTDEEVALALRSGWQPINLGPRVLRVETAAVVLAALLGQDH